MASMSPPTLSPSPADPSFGLAVDGDRHPAGVAVEPELVGSRTADVRVRALAGVVARPDAVRAELEPVVAVAAVDEVVPGAAVRHVRAALAEQLVVARRAEQTVGAVAPVEHVVARAAVDAVVAAAGGDPHRALRPRPEDVGARPRGDVHVVGGGVAAVPAEGQRVDPVAEVQRVVLEAVEALAGERDVVVAAPEVGGHLRLRRAADPRVAAHDVAVARDGREPGGVEDLVGVLVVGQAELDLVVRVALVVDGQREAVGAVVDGRRGRDGSPARRPATAHDSRRSAQGAPGGHGEHACSSGESPPEAGCRSTLLLSGGQSKARAP